MASFPPSAAPPCIPIRPKGEDLISVCTSDRNLPMRPMDDHRFLSLCRKAMDTGKLSITPPWVTWDVSNRCESPISRDFFTKSHSVIADSLSAGRHTGQNLKYMTILVMCRRCDTCKSFRSWMWRERATAEMAVSVRTWMCTFTIAPHQRLRVNILASKHHKGECFSTRYRVVGKYFTDFLKRLRENTKLPFRYMLVAEQHKDGFPHLHALIHDITGNLTKRQIEREWTHLGFTNVKLADRSAPRYVCKYISKDMLARVRASLHYGDLSHSDFLSRETQTPHPPGGEAGNVKILF